MFNCRQIFLILTILFISSSLSKADSSAVCSKFLLQKNISNYLFIYGIITIIKINLQLCQVGICVDKMLCVNDTVLVGGDGFLDVRYVFIF